MIAPAGTLASSVTGGGDCLRMPLAFRPFESSFSSSAVPGGVGSSEGWKALVLTEVVRRWRVKYDVDLGKSGLLECSFWGSWSVDEDRRLRFGEVVVEVAGDRWEGGV
jgi:hypothetical protein